MFAQSERKKNGYGHFAMDNVSFFMSFTYYVFLLFYVKDNCNTNFFDSKNAFSGEQISTLIFDFFFPFGFKTLTCNILGISSYVILLLGFNPITFFFFLSFSKQFWFVGCLREKMPVFLLTHQEHRVLVGYLFLCF